jgi:transitional endoplasmic reticulum ATPase
MPLSTDVDIPSIAGATERYTGADLENLVRKAGLHALRKDREANQITMEDFNAVLEETGPSVTPEMEDEYKKMEEYLKQESPGRGRRIGFAPPGE